MAEVDDYRALEKYQHFENVFNKMVLRDWLF